MTVVMKVVDLECRLSPHRLVLFLSTTPYPTATSRESKLRWITLLLTVECVHRIPSLFNPDCQSQGYLPCISLKFSRLFMLLSELNCLLFNNILLVSTCVCVSSYLFITVLRTILSTLTHTHTHTQAQDALANGSYKF